MTTKQEALASTCELLMRGRVDEARELIRREYPFVPVGSVERRYGEVHALRVFIRDGFIDRYSGERLVFPGTLRLLSLQLGGDFPYHPNWKMSETHLAYWQLSPTVDHVEPVSRGGKDDETNWVTTSMLRNSAKANWTLAELGWRLREPEASREWDGLLGWFLEYLEAHPELLDVPFIRTWHRAAINR